MSNTEALRKALAVIETDRRALLYSHAYPAGSLTIPADDEAGADALAKYDEAIHAIRTALAQRPAADDRWAAGYKHGAWKAQHCAAQPAATVVERADSATGVVECGSLNVSNNAQPAASGEPVAWIEGPHGEIRRNLLWKLDPMPPQSVAWSIPLYTMSPKATSGTCTPQPAPAQALLTDERLNE